MASVDEAVRVAWERGRAAFPALALGSEAFAVLAARHVEKAHALGQADRLQDGDLFLACACLARIPGALDRFEELYGPLPWSGSAHGEAARELRQAMLVKLFVPDAAGEEPKIAEYSGRGKLAAWISIAVARAAVDQRRIEQRTRPISDSFAEKLARSGRDIEISFLRGRYEEDFRAALHQALAALTDGDRTLLRLHYREGLTAAQLAPIVQASRATAHRRLQAAREELSRRVREHLKARLQVGAGELEGLLQLYGSRIVPALAAEIRQGLEPA
jgi:RNA polymerase sigma-70 factor (ECF subfamily)